MKWIGRIVTKVYITPCRNIGNIYICKLIATIERIIAYVRDTVGKCYTRKCLAIFKGVRTYYSDAIRNGDACKSFATPKRTIADARNRITAES